MKDTKNIFSHVRPPELPAHLEGRILASIRRHERNILYIKMATYVAALVASVSMLVAGGAAFGRELSQSGFLNLASLFFSDFSLAAGDIRDFGFSVIESFPMVSAAIVFAALTAVISLLAALFDKARYLGSHRFLAKG